MTGVPDWLELGIALALSVAGALFLPRFWSAGESQLTPSMRHAVRVAPLSVVGLWLVTAGGLLTLTDQSEIVIWAERVILGAFVVVFIVWLSVWIFGGPRFVIPPRLR